MSDMNGFIDAIGRDATDTVLPRIETLANEISGKVLTDTGLNWLASCTRKSFEMGWN